MISFNLIEFEKKHIVNGTSIANKKKSYSPEINMSRLGLEIG